MNEKDFQDSVKMKEKNLELSISLHKVADILMKEDYFNNLSSFKNIAIFKCETNKGCHNKIHTDNIKIGSC